MLEFAAILRRRKNLRGRNRAAPVAVRAHRASVALMALLLVAAPRAARAADDELPGRVGRIAEYAGDLYVAPENAAGEWSAASVNYPITSGDNLWVSTDGRAEVDYGGGQFRLAGDTNLHLSRLDDRQLALFVAQGRLVVRVRVLDPGDSARIDTPNAQVELLRPGLYRIDVAGPDESTVIVREGEASIALASGIQQVLPGQSVAVRGNDPANAFARNGVDSDGFDRWSASRDRRYESSRAGAYVSRQMVGAIELDEYGTWQNDPAYGAVWYPAEVAADWVPYRDGYWVQSGAWGLTWVDYAPWGYAPFHYGRWAHIRGRWAWCPGAYVGRPFWAPAFVAWYGGPRWAYSVSQGTPVYGWIPLGWGDRYVPWWGRGECGERCWTRYNRPYAVNYAERGNAPPTRYANAGVPGAITAVAGATLAGAKPVPSNLVRVPAQAAASAPVLALAPSVKPLPLPARDPRAAILPAPASTLYPTSRPVYSGFGSAVRPVMPTARPLPSTAAGGARSVPVPSGVVAPPLGSGPGANPAALAPAATPAAGAKPYVPDRNPSVNAPSLAIPDAGARTVPVPQSRIAVPERMAPQYLCTMFASALRFS